MKKTLCFLFMFLSFFLLTGDNALAEYSDCLIQGQVLSQEKGRAACLIRIQDKLLVIRKSKNKKLDLPGGNADKNEIAQCTAYRETLEEIGSAARVGRLLYKKLANQDQEASYIFHCMLIDDLNLQSSVSKNKEIDEVLLIDPMTLKKEDFVKGLKKVQKLFQEVEN